jgi:hypothetical protein
MHWWTIAMRNAAHETVLQSTTSSKQLLSKQTTVQDRSTNTIEKRLKSKLCFFSIFLPFVRSFDFSKRAVFCFFYCSTTSFPLVNAANNNLSTRKRAVAPQPSGVGIARFTSPFNSNSICFGGEIKI